MPVSRKVVLWTVFVPVALIALVVIVILTFDWNRLKPWLNDKVSDAIGRPFAVNGDLIVKWRGAEGETGWRSWIPWPRLVARDITIGNPDWASQPNFATARELIFVLRPLSLLAHRISLPVIAIDGPAVWLERKPDLRNNWTFEMGEKKPPSRWRLDLGTVVLSRGNLALSDEAKKIELRADFDTMGNALYDRDRDGELADPASAAAASEAAAREAASAASATTANRENGNKPPTTTAEGAARTNAPRYGVRWRATGHYNQATINAVGKAGNVLSLRDRDIPYPVLADVRVGTTRARIEGTLTNPASLGALDVHLQLSGDNMANLYPLTGVVLPDTRPYETRGRLTATLRQGASEFQYREFTGHVGGSDLAGSLDFIQRQPRPLLTGSLLSKQLLFSDLAPLIGANAKPGKAAPNSPVKQPVNKALPVAPFRTERWDRIDADVKFTGQRIVRDVNLPVTDLVTHLRLTDGVLVLDPLDFGMAGGKLVSKVKLDGSREPMAATIDLTARHLKLKQLFPKFESMRASIGEVNGGAKLSATGNSVATLLGSSNGEAKLLVENGTISKFILEAMGLNVGSVVISKLFGDKPVQINCGVSDFAVTNGIARARTFVVDTQDAVIKTDGAIDFSSEQLALTIHPDSKGLRVFSLRSPLYVGGTMKHPSVSPNVAVLALRAGGAVALALAAPVATAVIPLMNLSSSHESPCSTLLAETRDRPTTAPPPGQTYREPKAGARGQTRAAASAPTGSSTASTSSPSSPTSPSSPETAQDNRPATPRPPARPAIDRNLYQGG